MRDLIKRFFCCHELQFSRNIHGDEIILSGGKRSVWCCTKCDAVVLKHELYPFTTGPNADGIAATKTLQRLGYTWRGGTHWAPPLGPMPKRFTSQPDDAVQVVGVTDGKETLIGYATMPARMKARELAREQFGHFEDGDGSDAELCFGALEQLLDYIAIQPVPAQSDLIDGRDQSMDFLKEWKLKGELYECPNPPHDFDIGRLLIQWRWAANCWSTVTIKGYMHNYGLCFCTVNSLDGFRAFKIIVGKLSVMIGVRKKGPVDV